ncbi:MAG: zinc ribbon domain-containing protein [Burkholderiaceae bacterium]|nr:zinc ribbon domain-containing protein [Burkholderiaceae bacterium]
MNCPKCKAENADGAKFCSQCGQSLAVPDPVPPPPITNCPACQAPKAGDAKFCGACGYRFEAEEASAAAPDGRVEPVIDAPATSEEPPAADAGSAVEPKKNSNLIIIVAVVVVAIVGAVGCGWFLWSKPKAAPEAPAAASASSAQVQLGQPGAEGLQPKQPDQPAVGAQQPQPSGQPGAEPELDPYGNPVKPGAAASASVSAPKANGQAGKQKSDRRRELTPRYSEQPATPRKLSIDEQHRLRVAIECDSGPSGLFCREKVRYRLCKNHWSASPRPGQSICQRTE